MTNVDVSFETIGSVKCFATMVTFMIIQTFIRVYPNRVKSSNQNVHEQEYFGEQCLKTPFSFEISHIRK